MTINLTNPRPDTDFKPRITVVGVGGAGGNAVNNMIRAELEGVEFLVCNTDAQAMNHTLSERHIQLGAELTQGLGAGSRPDVGRAAAEESIREVMEQLTGNHMVFITAGMGGGTGTGAAPVIAKAAREQGMLCVGVVTKPFQFEGRHRMQLAEAGITELAQYVDTLIVIPNQNLFRVANEKTTFADAFKMADDVLYAGVRSVTDLMVMPGLINLDFADIRAVMAEMGKAMMGTGEAEGDKRAIEAAEAAIANPLLEDISMKGARGLLINITGSLDMTLMEVDEAVNRILEEVDPDAHMIFGSTFDESLQARIRISVVATGIDVETMGQTPRVETVASGIAAVSRAAREERPEPTLVAIEEGSVDAGAAPVAEETSEVNQALSGMLELMGASGDGEAPAPVVPQREATFIPPRPMQAEPAVKRAEPFAEAAIENAGGENVAQRRKPTFFERVTGVAAREKSAPAHEERIEPEAGPARPPETDETEQEKLGSMDPARRVTPTDADREMLDIPAFLRRQAN